MAAIIIRMLELDELDELDRWWLRIKGWKIKEDILCTVS